MKVQWSLILFFLASAQFVQAEPGHRRTPAERRRSSEDRLRRSYQRDQSQAVASCQTRANRCSQPQRLFARAYAAPHQRRPAFSNFTSAQAPGGVCWGYALVHRRFLAFARFQSPGAVAAENRAQARKVLLPISWGVPMDVPGVNSIEELSKHPVYGKELRKLMTENWDREFFKPSNLGWALRLRNPTENLLAVQELEARRQRGELPMLVVQFSVGAQHVVLVEGVKRNTLGLSIEVVDSNIPSLMQSFYIDNGGYYRPELSRNLYQHVKYVGLRVVDGESSERDYLGLAAECCQSNSS